MDRRQVLAGLAGSLALGSGCLGLFDSDGSGEESSADETGERSPSATATQRSTGSNRTETGQPTTGTETTHSSTATPSGSPSEPALINTANLATYTSDSAPYSIKYPASWRVTVANHNQETVKFTAPASPARMVVRVKDGVPSVVPRESIISTAVQRAKRMYSLDRVTRMSQRKITLPNGTSATVVKTRLSRSAADTMLRGTFLVAHVADTVYATGVLVPEHAATPSVEQAMKTLVESLTIQETT